jgi:streptogramin lyase
MSISGLNNSWANLANAVVEQESFVVTEEWPLGKLFIINATGNSTVVYQHPKGGPELYGVAVDLYGNFIACEPYQDRLVKITPTGARTIIYNFTKLSFPVDVAIDTSGNYIVTQDGSPFAHAHEIGIISKVTPKGVRTVVYNFPEDTYPDALAIDSSGNYIVGESGFNILSKVTPAGVRTVIYDFGSRLGEKPTWLGDSLDNNLLGIAIDSSGNYIVTEFNRNLLSKVTPSGVRTVIYNFTKGTNPIEVAVDSRGNYIVCERTTGVLSKITPSGERTVIYSLGAGHQPHGVVVLTPPRVADLKLTVKDGSTAPIKRAAVSSTAQPTGQTVLTGTSDDDGSLVFTSVLLGNYTLQAQKSGYTAVNGKTIVKSGGINELTIVLQVQPSSGIPGFPDEAMIVGVLLCVAWLFSKSHTKIH